MDLSFEELTQLEAHIASIVAMLISGGQIQESQSTFAHNMILTGIISLRRL